MRHLFVGGTFDSAEPSDWGLLVGVGMPAPGPAATWGEAVDAQGVSGPSSSCVWNPRVFLDDARECQCPFVLCLHPQGCLRRGVRATGSSHLPLGLALGSPIFPSGCEGKLGVALESLQGLRDLT